MQAKQRDITVLIPAKNEEEQIRDTILSVKAQTYPASRIVVLANDCTDSTEEIAREERSDVFQITGNKDKKAGALNQWLKANLPDMPDDDLVLVMDADSVLDPRFLENAIKYQDKGFPAVGGVFTGKPGGGWAGDCQKSEFERYKRDITRNHGKTLVLTGTATLFRVSLLKEVAEAQKDGRLPWSDGYVYATESATEDQTITYAIRKLGHRIIAPAECTLVTDVMTTWKALGGQRYRWKRGALECNLKFGLSRVTLKPWFLQAWGLLGIFTTAAYLTVLGFSLASGSARLHWIWAAVTGIYMLERAVTVRARGIRTALKAAILLYELPYDLYLQAVHLRAIGGFIFRTRKGW